MNYYQRLKDMREDRDLSQQEVAELLGIQQTHYSRYELGKQKMGIDKYIALSKFYNVSLDYLAGIVDTPKTLDGTPYRITKKITS
ncbi:MAG: helix-turn-helix transcriptional regulator [Clostridia bacterium]|nr:helix-turn-helix transcriptional regulator [Clostridia bacterium]